MSIPGSLPRGVPGRTYRHPYHGRPDPMRKRSLILWISAGVAGVILMGAAWIRLPYYSEGPGPAREVVPLISVKGRPTFDSGMFVMTTVSYRQLTGILALFAWIDPDQKVVDREVLYPGGQTVAQERQRSFSQMDTSKIDATSVVVSILTDYPKEHGDGVLIEAVYEGCPAEGRLFAGDLVDSIEGTSIGDVGDASDAINAVAPGDPLTFHVSAGGEEHDVTVTRGDCLDADRPLVGINMVNDFPFDVEISSGDVGGPSAGLMWSLGLYDLLTPGDLTDSRLIAGTGTMGVDGTVGPIGGITDKVVAARRAGAQVFLVPKDNLAQAQTADTGDMQLIPVGSFDQALEELGVGVPADAPAAA
jgi:Lon-like protease